MPDAIPAPPSAPLLARLREILGPGGLLTDPADTAPHVEDWRRLYRGRTAAVLRPATTAELAACVAACAEAGVAIVPQGGNTSMVGGAVPAEDGNELVLTLSRLNRIRAIDPVDLTLTIEAGATLNGAWLAAGWVNELLVYIAPKLLGQGRGVAASPFAWPLDDAHRWHWLECTPVGADLRLRLQAPG